MLSYDELIAIGTYAQPYQQEKDYIEELFLSEIFGCCNNLVFKGGTALSKFYGSPRFSDDLDFSISAQNGENDASRLNEMVTKLSKEIPIKLLRKINTAHMLKYELSIRGPLFERTSKYQHLKLEIGKHESVIESVKTIRRNPVYKDLEPYIAIVMSEKEILAEKVAALLYRKNCKARDLYDLYFLASKGVEVKIGLIDQKLREQKQGHVFTKERFDMRLREICTIWDKELKRLIPEKYFIDCNKAKTLVTNYFAEATLL